MEEKYQMTVRVGDIVRMPNNVVGIVHYDEIVDGGNCRIVRVYPFTNWLHRLLLTLSEKTSFYDRKINDLRPLHLALSS